jgi:hypothetical protein
MSKPKLAGLSFDGWVSKYTPMINHLSPGAAFDGLMFETHGNELALVLSYANGAMGRSYRRKVWTLVEDDEGQAVIVEGYHLVNRLGYFLTVKAAAAGVQYHISLD